ncbi:MAG: HDIG domain-containing protein [Caldisericum sp.]|jgi:putative nucleotidyltransferase with HDIG domain|nr:HDIG domain-containing protein [Caldisericum sp.]
MLTRDEAFKLLQEKVHDENLIKHMLATEAIMRSLARRFNEDEEKWGLTGLLHDIDYEETKENPEIHSKIGAQWLKDLGFEDDVVHAVLAHNERHGVERTSLLDKALWAVDPTTGFIIAVALVRPDKKLASVELKSMKKKFKEKSFAAGADREQIKSCETELGIPLDEFLELSLQALIGIADVLGL